MRQAILKGDEVSKPGFTRLNLSVLLTDEKVAFILDAVRQLATDAVLFEPDYDVDAARAIFYPRSARVGAA